jgi:hypothetical protein
MTTVTPPVNTYEAEFPPDRKPPAVANYTGRKVFTTTKPTYTVELDAGAFRAVWELLEAEARHRFPTREAMAYAAAYLRAVTSFRDAYWTKNEAPEPPNPRRLVRPKSRQQRVKSG